METNTNKYKRNYAQLNIKISFFFFILSRRKRIIMIQKYKNNNSLAYSMHAHI